MNKMHDGVIRRTPMEIEATATEWVVAHKEESARFKARLLEILADNPIHPSILGTIFDGDIPKPLTAIVRALGGEFELFKVSDNPYVPGQPAVALKEAVNQPGYWQKFKLSINTDVSAWLTLGIPSAGVNVGRIRYEIFSAFLRSIDTSVGRPMLTSTVMILFRKTSGMKFAEFFNGKPGQIAALNADGNELFTWTTSDDVPPLLSVCRVTTSETTPLSVVPQLALRDIRNAMQGKAPEAIDFEGIEKQYKIDHDSVLFAYLKELGNAVRNAQDIQPKHEAIRRSVAKPVVGATETTVDDVVVTGRVLFTSRSGVGVDVNGRQGFVPKSELSWDFVSDAAAVVRVGGVYKFKVIPDLTNNGGLFLSLKQMTEDPWKTVAARFPIGKPVTGIVVRYTENDDAALVSLAPGVTGRLQLREMTPDVRRSTASESLPKGTSVTVAVITMNRERNWLQLTMNVAGDVAVPMGRRSGAKRNFLVDGSSLAATIGVANTCQVVKGLIAAGYGVRTFFASEDFHSAAERKLVEEGIPKGAFSILNTVGIRGAFLLYASKHDDEIVSNAEYADSKYPIRKERVHGVSAAFDEILLPTLGLTFPANS